MNHLRQPLDQLLTTLDKAQHIAQDPIELVHKYKGSPDDIEVVGLLASSLAFGKVESIRQKVRLALSLLGEHPSQTIANTSREDLRKLLRRFQHRWTTGEDLADLLAGAATLRRNEGPLGEILAAHYQRTQSFRQALGETTHKLRSASRPKISGSFANLIPDVFAGSACKRLLLYCRWMIRPDDGVDLGVWKLPTSILIIPVDTHIARIANYIGLTEREEASWKTAEEITASLRALDPEDPVKYDFALCHLGISGSCPKKRHPIKCEGCPIRGICRL